MLTAEVDAARIDVQTVWTDGKSPAMSHLDWARGIAASIARQKGFISNSQESDELESVAVLTVLRKALSFRPKDEYGPGESIPGHFRGYSHRSVKEEVMREARRLRGGGTFWSPDADKAEAVRVQSLPTRITDSGDEEVMIADYRGAEEDDQDSF